MTLAGVALLAACSDGGTVAGGDIVAAGNRFNIDQLTFTAGEQVSLEFVNDDRALHNWALYEDEAQARAGQAIVQGEEITEGSTTINFTAPEEGEYLFQCDLHPYLMRGTAIVEGAERADAGGG